MSETDTQLIEEILRLEKELDTLRKEKDRYTQTLRQELSEGTELETFGSPATSITDMVLMGQGKRNENYELSYGSSDGLGDDLKQKIDHCIDCILKTYR